MEDVGGSLDNRLSRRFIALSNLEYYIEESVYYRSFSDEIKNSKKQILYSTKEESGKLKIQ
jgi:hypothetical protein